MDLRASVDLQEVRNVPLSAGIRSPILCSFNSYTIHIIKLQTAYEWQINIVYMWNKTVVANFKIFCQLNDRQCVPTCSGQVGPSEKA